MNEAIIALHLFLFLARTKHDLSDCTERELELITIAFKAGWHAHAAQAEEREEEVP